MTDSTAAWPGVGTELPPLAKPRFTSTHVLRWLAAQQNWDKIHFDQAYCRDVARLESPVINGALKQHFIFQFLSRAFGDAAWPWRVDYRFTGADHIGDRLSVQGRVNSVQEQGPLAFVRVELGIHNERRAELTTRGDAVVIVDRRGHPLLDALGVAAPTELALPREVDAPDPGMAGRTAPTLGAVLDERESDYAIDLSRLRLFADAVIGLPARHSDLAAGAASPYGAVVAPPLFPLHALEARPGARPLSEDDAAQGREGVSEVGRDLAERFGISAAGGMNAGNRVQVHSLARLGERVRAHSVLAAARRREGARGGTMLFVESLNDYHTVEGRPLLSERQTVVFRNVA